MPKSSIHLRPAKLFAMIHNIRGAYVSYLVDISEHNEYDKDFESVLERYNLLKNEAESNYYNRTKQHIQTAKNKYMWEAVVNIKTNHSMGDIQRLAKELEKKYGWKTLQIAIHKDEGHVDKVKGEIILNNHAHILFFMLSNDGIYLMKKRENGRKKMSELQTFVAKVLGMERGVSKLISKKVRLDHRQYRQVAEEKEALENNLTQTNSKVHTLEEQLLKEQNEKMRLFNEHKELLQQFEILKNEQTVSVEISSYLNM